MTFEEWYKINCYDGYCARAAWNASTLVEREACAKVCEELIACDEDDPGESFAKAIRNRSNETSNV